MSEPTRVAVIIVNYNGGEIVLRCLEALRRQTLPPHRILLVDNASQDNSLAVTRKLFRMWKPFLLQKIWGFPRLII